MLIVGGRSSPSATPIEEAGCTAGWALRLERVTIARRAIQLARAHPVDLVVLDFSSQPTNARRLIAAMRKLNPACAIVVVGGLGSPQATVECFRAGATDWIDPDSWKSNDEIHRKISAWLESSISRRLSGDRLAVLEAACRKLTQDRVQLEQRLGGAAANLAGSEEVARDREVVASMQAEFRMILSQEVEVESIIELTANYMIAKVGPTNAAIFTLEEERYRLAGYVRDDLSRKGAGGLIEHIGSSWCHAIAKEQHAVSFDPMTIAPDGYAKLAGVIPGRCVLAFACPTEKLDAAPAVIVLFRDGQRPFGPDALQMARAVGAVLSGGIERVRRVLSRAQPQWPKETPDTLE